MAEAPRNGPIPPDRVSPIPASLLAELVGPGLHAIRPSEVARGRQQAACRRFDDGRVVDEIASQLLLLSR
jgi:hypothetical protein